MDENKDIPADNGQPARVEENGEVRGSGVGIGGGEPGEDLSSDAGGSVEVLTEKGEP